MERFHYIITSSAKQEKTTWVCGKCKKDNMELILLGKWKLIDRNPDPGPCDLCGLGGGEDRARTT